MNHFSLEYILYYAKSLIDQLVGTSYCSLIETSSIQIPLSNYWIIKKKKAFYITEKLCQKKKKKSQRALALTGTSFPYKF